MAQGNEKHDALSGPEGREELDHFIVQEAESCRPEPLGVAGQAHSAARDAALELARPVARLVTADLGTGAAYVAYTLPESE